MRTVSDNASIYIAVDVEGDWSGGQMSGTIGPGYIKFMGDWKLAEYYRMCE